MSQARGANVLSPAMIGQRGGARAGIAILALVCGCGPRSPEEIVEREQRAVRSLAGTAQLVEASWRTGAVPRHFAEDALAGVSRSLNARRQVLAADTTLGAAARRALTDSAAALEGRVIEARGALSRPRRPGPSSPGSG